MTAEQLIQHLELSPHPEGGHYKEVFRSPRSVTAPGLPGPRNASTAIYFLLERHQRSDLHRVRSDEAWHHYQGAPLELIWLTPEKVNRVVLGSNLAAGEQPMAVVPQDCWQAARPVPGASDYSLVGCTVSPGFDFADFELPSREMLLESLPAHQELVMQFTSPSATPA